MNPSHTLDWAPFPHRGAYAFAADEVRARWAELHAGDCVALPDEAAAFDAWVLFHSGEFERATQLGLACGPAGWAAANRAAANYAVLLEPSEKRRLEILLESHARAQAHARVAPDDANAWYLQGFSLGLYCRGISVARALAQGLGARVKESLEKALALQPQHAFARLALGAFHAEVIDKVGPLVGQMTYGVQPESAIAHFNEALRLLPDSPAALLTYAESLLMLEGDARSADTTRLYQQAADCTPRDAVDWLYRDLARQALDGP